MKIVIDQARLREHMTVADFVALEEGKVSGVRAILALFMVDEKGAYLDTPLAVAELNKLKMGELLDLAPELLEKATAAASADPKAPSVSSEPTATA